MFRAHHLPILLLSHIIRISAQLIPTTLCNPGLCLQGYSNTTFGATVTFPGVSEPIHLLPGAYTATTNPQLLHDAITSSSSTISSSPGFNISSISLPLNLALQPGLSLYSGTLYSGQSTFAALPSTPIVNSSIPLTTSSLVLSANVWISINTSSVNRLIIWDAVPDISQLPASDQGSLSLVDMQSSTCNPSCASSGVCTSTGTCQCLPGFTGQSCETCQSGFFGSTCQPCPSNCAQCDDGISGSGKCLQRTSTDAPSNCNCKSGSCGTNGQCACNAGFTTGINGTDCSKCSPGFFQTSSGDCQICQIGCTQCADGNGSCITCKSGFTQDPSDPTKCDSPPQSTSGGQICPSGSFASGASCLTCSSSCLTCTAGTSNDCVICANGLYAFNGGCVPANSVGICQGSNLIADNNKHECDTCGASCLKCQIPNFTVASTVNQKQCTLCLPGFFLNNGTCVQSCPSGTTVAQGTINCIPCDPSCSTCAGSSTFCLSCSNNKLASGGKCVSTCPSGTFVSSGACLTCHPDCKSCSGGSFNQCTSCPSNRPVLANGRCLPTCAKNEFFDLTTGTCASCDSSCSSCSGYGSSSCLACSSASDVLQGGTCNPANCQSSRNVVPGLGVCLSVLVVQQPSATGKLPLPTETGLSIPIVAVKHHRLEWWQILLMALGCAFICLVVVWLFHRRQRKKRAQRTAMYASTNAPPVKTNWLRRLVRFLRRLFGHRQPHIVPLVHLGPTPEDEVYYKFGKIRDVDVEEARPLRLSPHDIDMVELIGSYNKPLAIPKYSRYPDHTRITPSDQRTVSDEGSCLSGASMYSQITQKPRKLPEPRQPIEPHPTLRFSNGTTLEADDQKPSGMPKLKNPFWK